MGRDIKLNCLQINLQHAKAASAAFDRRFEVYGHKIGLIQEPYARKMGDEYRITGISCGNKVYDKYNRPRACLVFSADVQYTPLLEFVSQDLVAAIVELKVDGFPARQVVCSGYHASSSREDPVVPELLTRLIRFCKSEGYQLIYGCDANAHNQIWGSKDSDRRGHELLEYITEHELEFLNTDSLPTYFVTRNVNGMAEVWSDAIDLTLATNFISHRITDWKVITEASCSDHRYIEFCITADSQKPQKYRNPKLTDWNKYIELVKANIGRVNPEINSTRQLDKRVEKLNSIIKGCYFESNKEKTLTTNRSNCWWNENLSAMRKKVRKRFKTAKRSNDWEQYHVLISDYKRAINKAKSESWKKTCNEMEHISHTAKIHKLLSKSHTNKLGTLLKEDGTYSKTDVEILEELAKSHFPGRSTEKPTNLQGTNNTPTEESEAIFSDEVIKWAIDSFGPFKSAGMDNIFPALLQKVKDLVIPKLKIIFIKSHAWGYIPVSWRNVKVLFIPKVGKKPSYEAKSYRPISLTSFCLKAMERILDRHIRDTILKENPLHENQFAYQEGKSTEAALKKLTDAIKKNYKNYVLGAFIDIAGAFDNTSHESIKRAMDRKGVDNRTSEWISAMLRDRQAVLTAGSSSQKFYVTTGCPQGGVLSPLLWSLVIDELIVRLNLVGFFTQAYADDVVILVNALCPKVGCELLEQALRVVTKWCSENNLSCKPEKTEIVLFTTKTGSRKRKRMEFETEEPQHSKLALRVNFAGEIIETKSEVKYLGVTLDKTLNWNSHLKKIIDKATTSLFVCKKMLGKSWGINPSMTHWMFTSIVRPTVSYAAFPWWEKTLEATTQKKLKKLQHLACLMILNCGRSTPTAAMEVLIDIPPLHIYIQYCAVKTNYRFQFSDLNQIRELTDRNLLIRNPELEELTYPSVDRCSTKYNFKKQYFVCSSSRDEWKDFDMKLEKKYAQIWFTDGSKMTDSGRAGYGVYHANEYRGLHISMGTKPSIFQAEVMAINEVASQSLSEGINLKRIHIYSDSKAALQALDNPEINSKIVLETVQNLNKLGANNMIKLAWVPGHSKIKGNDIADSIARKGSKNNFVGPDPYIGVPWSTINACMEKWLFDKRAEFWNDCPGLEHAKAFMGNLNKKRSKLLLQMNRTDIRLITGFLTGHFPVRYMLKKMNAIDDDICRFCGAEEETVEHLLCVCVAKLATRKRTLMNCTPTPSFFNNIDLCKLLNFLKTLSL